MKSDNAKLLMETFWRAEPTQDKNPSVSARTHSNSTEPKTGLCRLCSWAEIILKSFLSDNRRLHATAEHGKPW